MLTEKSKWKNHQEESTEAVHRGGTTRSSDEVLETGCACARAVSSGSYFPPPVRTVKIPKASGGERQLGIPTVSDRIAQMVVKSRLEPGIDPLFHPDSFGYRPGKSALDAVGQARSVTEQFDWVIDLDTLAYVPYQRVLRQHRS